MAPRPLSLLEPLVAPSATAKVIPTRASGGGLIPDLRIRKPGNDATPLAEATITTTMTATPTALNLGLPPREAWTDVRGRPSLSAEKVDAILASYGSPATGTGSSWVTHSLRYGIDNAVGLAFFIHESSAGTNPSWAGYKPDGTTTHNVGNIECAGYGRCFGRWRDYATWDEGIEDWYRLIAYGYVQQRGVTTIEEIIPIYAPEFENDVAVYVATVVRLIGRFRDIPIELWPAIPTARPRATPTETPTGTETPTEAPPVAGAQRMPNVVGMHVDEALATLKQLGIAVATVDMQTRERIPDLFDQIPPMTVISTQPGENAWVNPNTGIVLGVRAPDTALPAPTDATLPTATPTAPPAEPPIKPPGWNVFPATPTPEPPTAAPEPPTAAPEPPTAAPEPPTAAPEPPTAAPESVVPTIDPGMQAPEKGWGR